MLKLVTVIWVLTGAESVTPSAVATRVTLLVPNGQLTVLDPVEVVQPPIAVTVSGHCCASVKPVDGRLPLNPVEALPLTVSLPRAWAVGTARSPAARAFKRP